MTIVFKNKNFAVIKVYDFEYLVEIDNNERIVPNGIIKTFDDLRAI